MHFAIQSLELEVNLNAAKGELRKDKTLLQAQQKESALEKQALSLEAEELKATTYALAVQLGEAKLWNEEPEETVAASEKMIVEQQSMIEANKRLQVTWTSKQKQLNDALEKSMLQLDQVENEKKELEKKLAKILNILENTMLEYANTVVENKDSKTASIVEGLLVFVLLCLFAALFGVVLVCC